MPSRELWAGADPNIVTTSTNRNLLHPTKISKKRRESKIQKRLNKGKHRSSSSEGGTSTSRSRAPIVNGLIRGDSSDSSGTAARDQLVDLIVEDKDAEETERVRARKEGGAAWNVNEPTHFVLDLFFSLIELPLTSDVEEPTTTKTRARQSVPASNLVDLVQQTLRTLRLETMKMIGVRTIHAKERPRWKHWTIGMYGAIRAIRVNRYPLVNILYYGVSLGIRSFSQAFICLLLLFCHWCTGESLIVVPARCQSLTNL